MTINISPSRLQDNPKDASGSDDLQSFREELHDDRLLGHSPADRLRYIRHHNEQIAELNQRADDEIARVEAWRESVTSKPRTSIEHHSNEIKKWFSDHGHTTPQKFVDGVVKIQRGRERVEIVDAGQLSLEFFHAPTSPKPNLVAIKAHIKSTGEIPDGADLIRGDDQIVVEVSDA